MKFVVFRKVRSWLVLTIILIPFLLVPSLLAQEFPRPTGFVNDFAQVLSSEVREDLERDLTSFEIQTSVEIAIVTVNSLEETTIEDYSVLLFEDWKIGKKDKDNGVLLLVAPDERKVKIEVGYGLEPVLTDARAGRIIREEITPSFKSGDFDQGVTKGVAAIKKVVAGGEELSGEKESSFGGAAMIILLTSFFLLVYIAGFLARTKDFLAGGAMGVVLGAVAGAIIGSFPALISAALGLGLLGLLLDYILSRNYKERKKQGLPTSWRGSWGGFSSGGSSGGGFGGFGGGSSGGGGASGSW